MINGLSKLYSYARQFPWLVVFFLSCILYFSIFWINAIIVTNKEDLSVDLINMWGDWAVHFTMGSTMAYREWIPTTSPLPPGYSLLLTPMAWIDLHFDVQLYWIINATVGAATVVLIFFFANSYFFSQVAWITSLLTLLNYWFLLTSSSYFSHPVNALFIGLALLLFFNSIKQKGTKKEKNILFYSGLAVLFTMLVYFRSLNNSLNNKGAR